MGEGGAGLHVRDIGAGDTTVLLLHAGVVDGRGWLPVAERLVAAGWRVLVPDLRGFGRSPDVSGPFSHVEDAVAVLDAAGVDAVAVAGWSMGGGVACALAQAHPGRVTSLALVNSAPPGFDRDPAVRAAWTREEELWEAGDVDALARNDSDTWAVGAGRTADDTPASVIAAVEATARDQLARYREELDEADQTPAPTREQVRALPQLDLVVGSEHDYPDIAAAAQVLVDADPTRRFVMVDGCAHAGPLERPDAYAAVLAEWLRAAAPGS